jgi:hypothetical protein
MGKMNIEQKNRSIDIAQTLAIRMTAKLHGIQNHYKYKAVSYVGKRLYVYNHN